MIPRVVSRFQLWCRSGCESWYLSWAVIFFGILLRVRSYLACRSLWGDEANVAMNLVARDYLGLFKTLDHEQAAPIGFLLLTKWIFLVWGNHEYALRLIPLLCGIASVPIFYFVARKFLSFGWALFSLCLFAGSSPLIYYSSELKPYSCDVLVVLILLWLGIELVEKGTTAIRLASIAFVGAIAVWFSYTSIFVLAGLGVTLAIRAWPTRRTSELAGLCLLGFCWLGSFAIHYLCFSTEIAASEYMHSFWADGFLPWPPWPVDTLRWVGHMASEWLSFVVPSPLAFVAGAALVMGVIYLARKNRTLFCLLVSPVFFALLASALHKYPFGDRLWLFFVPASYILIAAGVQWLWQVAAPKSSMWKVLPLLAIACLLLSPAWGATKFLILVPGKIEIRPALEYLEANALPDDLLYQYGSTTPFRYYCTQPRFVLIERLESVKGKIENRDDERSYRADLQQLRGGRRVWMLFTHLEGREPMFLAVLDRWGKRLDEVLEEDASLYLYDLSQPARPDEPSQ